MEWSPLWISAKLALVTTAILLIVGVPLAWWLAYSRWKGKFIIEAIVTLPLVLPPTVLGFYLVVMLSGDSAFGGFLKNSLGLELLFTFPGLVLGSVIYSLPFMVNPLVSGFRQLPGNLREAAFTLGKSNFQTLWQVLLPNLRIPLISAGIMTFAHTIGEFGVVLMVGAGIPGKTRVASVAIYDQLELQNYGNAHAMAAILLGFSFAVLLITTFLNRKHSSGPIPK